MSRNNVKIPLWLVLTNLKEIFFLIFKLEKTNKYI